MGGSVEERFNSSLAPAYTGPRLNYVLSMNLQNVTNNSQGIFMEEEGAREVANQHFLCPTRHGQSREGEQSHRLRTAPLHRAPSSFPCVIDIEHTFPKKGTWWVGWGGGSRNLPGNTRCRFPFLLKKMVPVEDINVNHHTNLNISHHLKSPINAICVAEQPFASSTPYCCIPGSYRSDPLRERRLMLKMPLPTPDTSKGPGAHSHSSKKKKKKAASEVLFKKKKAGRKCHKTHGKNKGSRFVKKTDVSMCVLFPLREANLLHKLVCEHACVFDPLACSRLLASPNIYFSDTNGRPKASKKGTTSITQRRRATLRRRKRQIGGQKDRS